MNKDSHSPALEMFLFYSDLLGRNVVEEGMKPMGRLVDLKVRLGELFPKVTALMVKRRREKGALCVRWSEVLSLNGSRISLKAGSRDRFAAPEPGQDEILLCEDLLDRQVVDTHGAKIERVNDIHFLVVHSDLHIVHVDIGIRGILRRLGWLRAADSMTNWLFAYQIQDKMVSWKYVQPLAADTQRHNLKLNVNLQMLRRIHPSDLADILEDLDQEARRRVFTSLDLETAADTLEEIDPKLQASLIEAAPVELASDILEEMAPDEATDLLADLPEEKKLELIQTIEEPYRRQLQELLRFREGTAGSIMTKDWISLEADRTIGDAIAEFRKTTHPLETVAYIYVTDSAKHLTGVLTLRHLVVCDREERLSALMNTNLIKVRPHDDVDEVAEVFKKYKFLAVPVVDDDNRISGIITLKDVVEFL